jgi:two-component system, chemotaxis family, sensor kinase CheA
VDLFDIDMEFLRRLDGIRLAVRGLVDGSAAPVLTSIASAEESAEGMGGAILRLFAKCWSEAPTDDISATSRLATTTVAALECIEQSCVADDTTTANTLINQAASTMLKATDRDQSEWQSFKADIPSAAAPEAPTQPVAPLPQVDPPDLDELASIFLLISPEDQGEVRTAIPHVDGLLSHAWLPEQFRPHLQDASEDLAYATSGKRKTKKKTAAAEAALGQICTVIDELMIIIEGARSSRPGMETVSPEASPPARPQPVSVLEMELAAGLIEFDDPEPGDEGTAEYAPEPEPADEEASPADARSAPDRADSFHLAAGTEAELLDDFVTEGFDYLEQAEQALLMLENKPGDDEAINVVFRAFHTIKGVAGFLELEPISTLAHHAETLLSSVREGNLLFSPAVADITLKSSDTLRELLSATHTAKENSTSLVSIPSGFWDLVAALSDQEVLDNLAQGIAVEFHPSVAENEDVEDQPTSDASKAQGEGSVRVKTHRLDRLLDLVGELVVAHAMVAEDDTILADNQSMLARKVSRSEKILRELQDMTTSMRMVPMKPAFHKLSRVVRDVSRRAGKPVELIAEGEDTELDRNMVNIITDPLVHMMRNAIDHGLETPDQRIAAGKPEVGVVKLRAEQSGGSVVIEISDDGRGIHRDKISSKAIERGIIESDRGMSDSEVYNLVFAPGFSTAESVTDISGRGVGMDVVKRSVESLRGRIDIRSTPGAGSVFSIHLPLTLAITDGMLIRVGGERYIIPTIKIHMSMRPEQQEISTVAGRGEMVMLQGQLVPVIRLHEVYGIPEAKTEITEGLVVIVGEGTRRSALLVDELLGQQQFVVKALNGQVADVPGVAGGTIMGDGSVGLILDPEEIITLWRGGSARAKLGAA